VPCWPPAGQGGEAASNGRQWPRACAKAAGPALPAAPRCALVDTCGTGVMGRAASTSPPPVPLCRRLRCSVAQQQAIAVPAARWGSADVLESPPSQTSKPPPSAVIRALPRKLGFTFLFRSLAGIRPLVGLAPLRRRPGPCARSVSICWVTGQSACARGPGVVVARLTLLEPMSEPCGRPRRRAGPWWSMALAGLDEAPSRDQAKFAVGETQGAVQALETRPPGRWVLQPAPLEALARRDLWP